jgi:hypothetical protein
MCYLYSITERKVETNERKGRQGNTKPGKKEREKIWMGKTEGKIRTREGKNIKGKGKQRRGK